MDVGAIGGNALRHEPFCLKVSPQFQALRRLFDVIDVVENQQFGGLEPAQQALQRQTTPLRRAVSRLRGSCEPLRRGLTKNPGGVREKTRGIAAEDR